MLARIARSNGASSLSVLRVVRPWDRPRVMAGGGPRSSCASTSLLSPTTEALFKQLARSSSTSSPARAAYPALSAAIALSPPPSRPPIAPNCPRCCSSLAARPPSVRRLRKLNPAMSATQTREHMGHSHGHSHGHGHGHHHHGTDPALLLSSDKNDAAVRITRLGLLLNVVLAVGKGFAGYYWNSKSAFSPAFPRSSLAIVGASLFNT